MVEDEVDSEDDDEKRDGGNISMVRQEGMDKRELRGLDLGSTNKKKNKRKQKERRRKKEDKKLQPG